MEVQEEREFLVVCASLAKLLQIRIGPCVAEQETSRRQTGDGRQGQNSDFFTDQQNGQMDWQKAWSIWLDIREGKGQVNYVTL